MDSLSLSRKYDKFLDKIQQKEAEIPLHQTESEQHHQKEVLQQQQSAPLLSFSILYLSNSLSIALIKFSKAISNSSQISFIS